MQVTSAGRETEQRRSAPEKVAIVHYHLDPGGVTKVIFTQLAALEAGLDEGRIEVLLVYGREQATGPAWLAGPFRHLSVRSARLPELDYDYGHPARSAGLPQKLQQLLADYGFGPHQCLLHIHNHSLGKNLHMSAAIRRLAQAGYRLLLHIHDFAEDYRPANYRLICERLSGGDLAAVGAELYPQADSIHYAVLNCRDRRILQTAGFASKRVHLLPNPVQSPGTLPDRQPARQRLFELFGVCSSSRYVLYPVRAIRRKNVGEALLWSALAGAGTTFSVSLPTINPAELELYQSWKNLAANLDLPFIFETGVESGLSFVENLAASDLLLTTSVAEGFGLVFLEAWLAGRVLVGRDLPEVTADFREAGLSLCTLQERLLIPLELVGAQQVGQRLVRAYRATLRAYGLEPPDSAKLQVEVEKRLAGAEVDFADLDEPLQQAVIARCRNEPSARHAVLELNPWLVKLICADSSQSHELVQRNARVVGERFGLRRSGLRLLAVYSQLLEAESGRRLESPGNAKRILDEFLAFGRFRPVRC